MRPAKLTPNVVERIEKAVSLGVSYDEAARATGIHPSTFYRWRARGREAKRGKFHAFSERVDAAEAKLGIKYLEAIERSVFEERVVTKERVRKLPDGSIIRDITTASCAKTRPSRHRRKNCALSKSGETLAHEQVTRRPPTRCFRHQVLLRGCGQWYRCGRERVARPRIVESATIKGLATPLCFWTRRAPDFTPRLVRTAPRCAFYLFIRAPRT